MAENYRNNRHDEDDSYRRGGGQRDWSQRAGDEMRSWFGDDDAQARRMRDERESNGGWNDRGRDWNRFGGSGGSAERERPGSSFSGGYGGEYGDRGYGERGNVGGSERSGNSGVGNRNYGSSAGWSGGHAYEGVGGYGPERQRLGQGPSVGRGGSSGSQWSGSFGYGGSQSGGYGGPRESGNQGFGSHDFGRDQGYGDRNYGDQNFGDRSYGARPSGSDWGGSSEGRGQSYGSGYGQGSGSAPGYGSSRPSYGGYEPESGSYGRQSYAGRGPKDYKRSDERIQEEVSDRLTDDHSIDASEVNVQVKGGDVTLSGTVSSREQKRRVEDLVESISGVSDVTNNLKVKQQTGGLGQAGSPSVLGLSGQSPNGQASSQANGGQSSTSATGSSSSGKSRNSGQSE